MCFLSCLGIGRGLLGTHFRMLCSFIHELKPPVLLKQGADYLTTEKACFCQRVMHLPNTFIPFHCQTKQGADYLTTEKARLEKVLASGSVASDKALVMAKKASVMKVLLGEADL